MITKALATLGFPAILTAALAWGGIPGDGNEGDKTPNTAQIPINSGSTEAGPLTMPATQSFGGAPADAAPKVAAPQAQHVYQE